MKRTNHSALTLLSLFMMMASLMTIAPGSFAQDDDNERRRSSQPSLTQSVALGVQEALNLSQEDPPNINGAIARLNKVISDRGDRLQGYDKATVYEVRGSFKAQSDDLRGSLRDFQTAVDTGALPVERANGLRYYIAQIQFQLENYDAAISGLREWLRLTEEDPPANAYYLLGLAYVQKEDYRSAQQPMERALQLKGAEADKNYFNVLNLIYSENNAHDKRAALLERMINLWPDETSYWQQLAGAYATNNRDKEAFSVLEVAYRAGLLTREDQIIQLIQYYSFYENAYRGAQLLEREMNAGVVPRTQDNLILLSQLWDQSREAKKAIPILREAARNAPDGVFHFRLARVLVADEQYVEADKELLTAIRKGGLRERDRADAWMLLGNARFSRAATDDIPQLLRAREAFQNASRFQRTRRDASRWITYINELIRVQREQTRQEILRRQEQCRVAQDTLINARRVLELQGQDPDLKGNYTERLSNELDSCKLDLNGTPLPGSVLLLDENGDPIDSTPNVEETNEGEGEE